MEIWLVKRKNFRPISLSHQPGRIDAGLFAFIAASAQEQQKRGKKEVQDKFTCI